MNYKIILSILLLLCIFYITSLIIIKRETFFQAPTQPCPTKCITITDDSDIKVNPDRPECVGICINQHTYTKENTEEYPSLLRPDSIGNIKYGHNNRIIKNNCGLCISNFYEGLKLMDSMGNQCSTSN